MVKNKIVVVGMSGGVDSSVAALLLKKEGYKVVGAFMKNFSDSKNPLTGECYWREEFRMAQKIANILKIQLFLFDFEKEYKKSVIEPMFKDYKNGLTPNPDILCNTLIKFPLFWKKAKKLGADYMAMGHYARIKKTRSGYNLFRGKDKNRDQSYFLYQLSQKDLEHTIFPIGSLTKEKVREIANANNFPNAYKKGTRGICFVGKTNIKKFLEQKIKNKKGIIISPKGEIIGYHPGIMYYTVGQRIGPHLSINISKPRGTEQKRWYIAEKRKNNIIVAAPENHPMLKKNKVIIKKFHKINPKEKIPTKLEARIRHLGKPHSGRLIKKNNSLFFIFDKPIEGLAEGQSIVLYKKDKVIGGGIIGVPLAILKKT